jgi:ribonucleoside-diphosphate reductase alpha chain
MGLTAEAVANEYNISREDQDAFALASHQKAKQAIDNGYFKKGILPIEINETYINEKNKRATRTYTIDTDEGVRADTTIEALAKERPDMARVIQFGKWAHQELLSSGHAKGMILQLRSLPAGGSINRGNEENDEIKKKRIETNIDKFGVENALQNKEILQKRKATGEPYIMYKGNVNKANPEMYKKNGLKVHMTNICSEIVLHTDEQHSFVCCLSSLNLAKYDEWKDTDLVYTATVFLDGVLEEFIQRAKNMKGFENAVRSAEKGRALGLGVLGWHTYLQQKGLPFEGLQSQFETRKIFSQMKIESERASRDLANEYGEPLWCKESGFRNTHLRAVAPTVSNSKLSGNVSSGIEPWAANVFTEQTSKGTFIRKNPELEKVLKRMAKNTKEVWDKILADGGSVQDLDFLDDWCFSQGKLVECKEISIDERAHRANSVKDVFKTFKEINQLDLVRQAGVRQQYIDQAVSLNLAFPATADPKWINQVHLEAWKQGVKTLYYMRTESVLRGDIAAQAMNPDCVSCEG